MTQDDIRALVDDLIERELASHLARLGGDVSSIRLLGEAIEHLYAESPMQGDYYSSSLRVLVPAMSRKYEGTAAMANPEKAEAVFAAITFAAAYYMLRDYIFFSYNSADSIEWTRNDDNIIDIHVKDKSIFRQFVVERQLFLKRSKERPNIPVTLVATETVKLLTGTSEWDETDERVRTALASIEAESEWKIDTFCNFLPSTSSASFGRYAYSDYRRVYKEVMYLALYARYYSVANDMPFVVDYPEDRLAEAIAKATHLPVELCTLILRDLALSSLSTFVRIAKQSTYLLFPWSFSMTDCILERLKLLAQQDQNLPSHFSNALGSALVQDVASWFSNHRNFRVLSEVSLREFDATLPDIDVLAISYEPSLGFHIFVCEVKNTLPASWAKEYLKAIGPKGYLTKAMLQVDKLTDFLRSDRGTALLYDIITSQFSHLDLSALFPTGFVGVPDVIIVTSQNNGLFFPGEQLSIINCDLLKWIVASSDGDVNYILACLRGWGKGIDQTYSVGKRDLKLGDYIIQYDVATFHAILQLSDHVYLADNVDLELERESLASGYRFIDHLKKP